MTEWPVVDRMLWRARQSAFPAGEFVGQESFVSAGEIRRLAESAGVGDGVSVLDVCCGVGGPGLMLVRELGCDYLGVDCSAVSVERARGRAADEGLDARFEVSSVPPLPGGAFEVVLLLETMLAFRAKGQLLRSVAGALEPGGRFAFTVEEGRPLSAEERAELAGSDTVWLTPLAELEADLVDAGFRLRSLVDCTAAHRNTVGALLASYLAAAPALRAAAGRRGGVVGKVDPVSDPVGELISTHRVWSRWLASGRVRKFAVVVEKVAAR